MRVDPPELKKVPLLPPPSEVVVVDKGAAEVVLDDDMAAAVVSWPSESRTGCEGGGLGG